MMTLIQTRNYVGCNCKHLFSEIYFVNISQQRMEMNQANQLEILAANFYFLYTKENENILIDGIRLFITLFQQYETIPLH